MKLQLKRSNVLDGGKAKEPTPPYVEYGELCVNYNVNDPALFIKDSNDNIIRIAGKNSVGSGSNPSGPNLPGTGNNIGDVFFNTGDLILYYWDGNQWVPIASQEHAADIYVGTFAEVDVEIPVADRRNGLLLWETEEGNLFLWYIDADTAQWVVAVPGGGSGGGGGSSNVTVLDVAPNNPKQGDLWYCTLDGRLYIYYEDVNTSQWVDASPDNLAEGFWERDGTTLKPIVAGDDVDLGTGDLSATAGTFDGQVRVNEDVVLNNDLSLPNADTPAISINHDRGSGVSAASFRVLADGTIRLGDKGVDSVDTNPNATIRSNGSAQFSNQDSGSDAALSVTAGGTPRFYVERSGRVLIGDNLPASPNITLNANGSAVFEDHVYALQYKFTNAGNNNARYGYDGNGHQLVVVNLGNGVYLGQNSTSWQGLSDRRFKSSLEEISDGLEKVSKIKGYTGKFINDESEKRRPFLIAQEVAEVIPEAVDLSNPERLGMAYQDVVPLLVSALHDTKDRIEALEATNASLEARLTALEGGN